MSSARKRKSWPEYRLATPEPQIYSPLPPEACPSSDEWVPRSRGSERIRCAWIHLCGNGMCVCSKKTEFQEQDHASTTPLPVCPINTRPTHSSGSALQFCTRTERTQSIEPNLPETFLQTYPSKLTSTSAWTPSHCLPPTMNSSKETLQTPPCQKLRSH